MIDMCSSQGRQGENEGQNIKDELLLFIFVKK